MNGPSPAYALGAARTLALTRIVAGLVIATSADVHHAASFASLDHVLSVPPWGLGWLSDIPISRGPAELLRWAVVGGALIGALGIYARTTWTLTASGLLVLLALPQSMGAVAHVHHLVWVAAMLAASPCADVGSIDARFEPRPLRSSAAYALPVLVLRGLVGAIYFFPGLHKLLTFIQGVEPGFWFRSHLHWKWMQAGAAPALPVAVTPSLLTAAAVLAVSFELSMPLLVCFRRTRPLALLAALLFHAGTAYLLYIRFETLLVVLVSLIDIGPSEGIVQTLRDRAQAGIAARVVGATLLFAACVTGAIGTTQLYPFACFPTFADAAPPTMPSARVDVLTNGRRCALPRPRGNAEWVQSFRIAGAYGDVLSEERARAYVVARFRAVGQACPLQTTSTFELHAESLRWDDATPRVALVSQRRLYAVAAASLGIAPDEGAKPSSSPTR